MDDVEVALYVCSGKEAFPTFKAANLVLKRMRPRRNDKRVIGIYRCTACDQFHIGSTLKSYCPRKRQAKGGAQRRNLIHSAMEE